MTRSIERLEPRKSPVSQKIELCAQKKRRAQQSACTAIYLYIDYDRRESIRLTCSRLGYYSTLRQSNRGAMKRAHARPPLEAPPTRPGRLRKHSKRGRSRESVYLAAVLAACRSSVDIVAHSSASPTSTMASGRLPISRRRGQCRSDDS